MNKVLIWSLFGMFLCAVGVGGFKVWQAQKEITKLSNQLAQSQKVVQETKSAWSVAAQRVADLEASSKDLQKKIEDRDEEVAALGAATLRLKDQLFKIKNATQTPVDENGEPTNEEVACEDQRIRVDFSEEQNFLNVEGFCITNPPYAQVEVTWTRPLQLAFVLTKKNDQYRMYLDSNSPDIISVEAMSLRVDSSIFKKRWYEKIALGVDLALYNPLLAVRVTSEIGDSAFLVGPFIALSEGPSGLQKSLGLSFGWRPFDAN